MRFLTRAVIVSLLPLSGAPCWASPANFDGATPINRWWTPSNYPPEAIRANEQGLVDVEFEITATGKPANCAVVKSSGYPVLDESACKELLKRARFRPALDDQGSPRLAKASATAVYSIPR